jgi:hypothetical protein
MSVQSAMYSEKNARTANLSMHSLEVNSWDTPDMKALQKKIGAKPIDGWFGPKSIKAWKAWHRKHCCTHFEPLLPSADMSGKIIVGGEAHAPPAGVKVVNHLEANGIPAEEADSSPRKVKSVQFVFHRGAQTKRKSENYAQSTERVLNGRGLSTTLTMDVDGTIYQHFDPTVRRGRHATHHNVQSDSIDIAGPFDQTRKPVKGQKKVTLKMAIGRKNDGLPPLARKAGTVKCWTMTPEQEAAVIAFIPWYCELREIPMTACKDWRSFRVGTLGRNDPVTRVLGLVAHTQISDPGRRVDGILPLIALKAAGDTGIEWRSGEDFLTE